MNLRTLIILFLMLFMYCCQKSKDQSVSITIYKWEIKNEKESGVYIEEDTIRNTEYLYLEKSIKLEKHVVDSLIGNNYVRDKVNIDNFVVIIDTIFNRDIEGKLVELAKINFAIIENGYYVTTIYGQDIGLLVKDYHGHGRCLLCEVKHIQNGNIITTIDLAKYSKSLIEDNTLFPSLPPPPPLPMQMK